MGAVICASNGGVSSYRHTALPFPQSDDLLVTKLVTRAHRLPFARRLNLSHDLPGLLVSTDSKWGKLVLDSPQIPIPRLHPSKNTIHEGKIKTIDPASARV